MVADGLIPKEAPVALPRSLADRWPCILAILLLAVHSGLLLYAASQDFVTYDEAANISAGIYYWNTGDYRLYSVNPPLTKLAATLPVLAADPILPPIYVSNDPGRRIEWHVGDQFAQANASGYQRLVVLARLAGIGWSVIGGLIIYCWANQLFGSPAGLIGLAVWCIEPNVLTHAHLATADLPAAVAALAAAYAFWSYLRTPTWTRACVAGVVLGLAQLVKTTLIVLYPLWLVLWVAFRVWAHQSARKQPTSPAPLLRPGAVQLAVLLLLSLGILNLGYEFEGTGRRLKDYSFISRSLGGLRPNGTLHQAGSTDNRFRDTWLGEVPVPLPASYVSGIDVQRRGFEGYEGHLNFLRGEWRVGGWWYYYLYACAVKIPLGILGLLGLAVAVQLTHRQPNTTRFDLFLLWAVPTVIFCLVSSQLSMNKHVRYVLPAFPFVAVGIGAVAVLLRGDPLSSTERSAGARPLVRPIVVFGLLLWAGVSSLSVYPCSVSYFNEAAGGPANGHWHLSGTNVDIGQDLWRLRDWLDAHPDPRPLGLAYHNQVDPGIAGLQFTLPPVGVAKQQIPDDPSKQLALGPHPGRYALSVRYVQGQRGRPPDGSGNYDQQIPTNGYAYFQHFQPIARAGYAIFIYDISLEEANRVRQTIGLQPLPDAPGRVRSSEAEESAN